MSRKHVLSRRSDFVVLGKDEAYFEARLVDWCELFVLTLIGLSNRYRVVPTSGRLLNNDQYVADFGPSSRARVR